MPKQLYFVLCLFFLQACAFYRLIPPRKESSKIIMSASFKDAGRNIEKYLIKKRKRNYIANLNIKADSNNAVYSFIIRARHPIGLNKIFLYQNIARNNFPTDSNSLIIVNIGSNENPDTLFFKSNGVIQIDKSREYNRIFYRLGYYYLRK